MNLRLKKIAFTLLLWLVLPAAPARSAEETELIGQGNDGNRNTPVHRFELFDEQGIRIRAGDKNPRPFSIEKTCGECHDYTMIAKGWHFNAHDPNVESGKSGEPWVLVDSKTRTQIPITARKWKGTYAPGQLGITPWQFLKTFYSHFPGGSYGQMDADNPDEAIRQEISGKYEINCLACHHTSPQEDQSMAALQAARQNFRWISAASSGKAVVSGVALSLSDFFDPEFEEGIKIAYNEGVFDEEDMVFFDITMPSNDRCYFCHSDRNLNIDADKEWQRDEDVHLQSGLNCIDCHRNNDDHMITRGTETEGPGKSLTCEGCHLGDDADLAESGRLGAPQPMHLGIPTIHFEKLTCTACHSGTMPEDYAGRWKAARMHKTGLHGAHNLEIVQPHLYAPVLIKGADGKIGPYKLFWPAFWGYMNDQKVMPMDPQEVLKKAREILEQDVPKDDDWRPLTQEQIRDVLRTLKDGDTVPVYIAGGKLYKLDSEDKITAAVHDAAQPYTWPLAHDVRPAEQSLGIRNCQDCHATDSAFFFGKVEIDSPVRTTSGPDYMEMVQLQGIDRFYMWIFNFTFVFRPFLKVIAFASCGLIGVMVLAYILRAAAVISNGCDEENK